MLQLSRLWHLCRDTQTRVQETMGLLADEPMRKGKKMCHALFDPLWQGQEHTRQVRVSAYATSKTPKCGVIKIGRVHVLGVYGLFLFYNPQ